MKAIVKLTILALSAIYCLAGFAILSPLISAITRNAIFLSIGLSFALLFLMSTFAIYRGTPIQWKGIFVRLEEGEMARTWLFLHSLFTYITTSIFPIITVFSSMAVLFLTDYANAFPTTFMSAWMILLLSVIGLWYLHSILGMGYRWFCKGTTVGIRSFSISAIETLRKKERKGIIYLLNALLLLKEYLQYEELKLQIMNRTIGIIRCLLLFKSKIPYNKLKNVAAEVKNFPSVERLPQVLSTFSIDSKVYWATTFTVIPKIKRAPLEWIVAIATILAALTFVPEDTRIFLFGILQSVGSIENIQIVIGFFFLVVAAYITSLDETYHLNPLKTKLP